jgi:hypothetical protein
VGIRKVDTLDHSASALFEILWCFLIECVVVFLVMLQTPENGIKTKEV